MIDPRRLRQDLLNIAARVGARGTAFDVSRFEALEDRRKAAQLETEHLQQERRRASRRIGAARSVGEDIAPMVAIILIFVISAALRSSLASGV